MNRFEPEIHRKWRNTRRYRRNRERFLNRHTKCVPCSEKGFIGVGSEQVHHVVRPEGDPHLFWSESNWLAVCEPCHIEIERKYNSLPEPPGYEAQQARLEERMRQMRRKAS